jgi:hypothetical protein
MEEAQAECTVYAWAEAFALEEAKLRDVLDHFRTELDMNLDTIAKHRAVTDDERA